MQSLHYSGMRREQESQKWCWGERLGLPLASTMKQLRSFLGQWGSPRKPCPNSWRTTFQNWDWSFTLKVEMTLFDLFIKESPSMPKSS